MKSVEKGINKYEKGKIIMNVEELLEEAWKSVQDEKIKDAVIYLETILEIDRYNLEAFLMLIRIYLRMENYEIAMEYCEEAYEKFDKNLDVIFSMGLLYQTIGKNKKVYTEKNFQINGKNPKIITNKVISKKMIENFIESDDEIVITKFYENNEGMEYKPFDFSFSIKKDEVKKIYFKDGAIYIWDN